MLKKHVERFHMSLQAEISEPQNLDQHDIFDTSDLEIDTPAAPKTFHQVSPATLPHKLF